MLEAGNKVVFNDTLTDDVYHTIANNSLIDPINTVMSNNYANAQASLRKHEIDMAKQVVKD